MTENIYFGNALEPRSTEYSVPQHRALVDHFEDKVKDRYREHAEERKKGPTLGKRFERVRLDRMKGEFDLELNAEVDELMSPFAGVPVEEPDAADVIEHLQERVAHWKSQAHWTTAAFLIILLLFAGTTYWQYRIIEGWKLVWANRYHVDEQQYPFTDPVEGGR